MTKLTLALVPVVCASLLTLAPTRASAQNSKSGPALGAASMDATIHDYILAHPEVMLESIRTFELHRRAAEQQQAQAKVRENLPALQADSPASSRVGTAQAVTIVEFFDYRCGFCKKVQPTVAELAQRANVRIIYKDLPILGPDSVLAAKAALAAEEQGGYQKLHDLLIASAAPLTDASIAELASRAGLDTVRLKKDMDSPEVNAAIARNMALAEKLSVQATPTFVVGEQMVSGALTPEAFENLIKTAQPASVVASIAR